MLVVERGSVKRVAQKPSDAGVKGFESNEIGVTGRQLNFSVPDSMPGMPQFLKPCCREGTFYILREAAHLP